MKFSEVKGKTSAEERVSGGVDKKTIDKKTQKTLLSLLGKFEGRPQEELIAEILSVAAKSRKEGKLSDSEIDSFYQMLSPVLDTEKKKMLDDIVKRIKAQ